MKTGNTRSDPAPRPEKCQVSMEPGHEDREYHEARTAPRPRSRVSMEPGHEDREYSSLVS